ncbi:hypothetical protein BDP27DRAFT_1363558 [Rhodocollybia butyracea]|uniref:Uncharacterized protein n=1 Tax=Rhodocollybia butyracea TaxID=206335 RepID=A0A9P5PSL7_9AGAR|nr:hypothetical protein BDP27DRAFT_1363558 [Rhodocollybia butyracea]
MTTINVITGRLEFKPPAACPKNPLHHTSFSGQHTECSDGAIIDENASFFTELQQVKKENNLLRKLLRTDQREFIVGTSAAVALEAAHIVSPIRITRRNEKKKVLVKERVEAILTRLWFNHGQPFLLDSRPNMILLNSVNHCLLDLHGALGISPGEVRLGDILVELLRDNQEWKARVASGGVPQRNLDMSKPVYDIDTIEWEVVVMHEEDFFPPGDSIFAHNAAARTLRDEQPVSSPTSCHVPEHQPDSQFNYHHTLPYLLDSNNDVFRFKMRTTRPPTEKLSLFAMMVNLQSKLYAYIKNTTGPYQSITGLLQLVDLVISAIYFEPRSPLSVNPAATEASFPTPPSDEGLQALETGDGDPIPGSDLSAGGHDDGSPEPVDEKGLTYTETCILLNKIESGELQGAEKAKAAQMLLFGVRGPEEPIRLRDFDEEEEE